MYLEHRQQKHQQNEVTDFIRSVTFKKFLISYFFYLFAMYTLCWLLKNLKHRTFERSQRSYHFHICSNKTWLHYDSKDHRSILWKVSSILNTIRVAHSSNRIYNLFYTLLYTVLLSHQFPIITNYAVEWNASAYNYHYLGAVQKWNISVTRSRLSNWADWAYRHFIRCTNATPSKSVILVSCQNCFVWN